MQAKRDNTLTRVRNNPALKRLYHLFTIGMQQVQVARSLGVTRQYVCTEVGEAMACGLMERNGEGPLPGWCLAPELQDAIGNEERTFAEVHNFRLKFHWKGNGIGGLARDRRTGFIRVSPMRGGERLVFWNYMQGYPDVTIQVHPHTLLAYVANPGHVEARDEPEAEVKMREAVEKGVAEWARLQGIYGDGVQVSGKGELVTHPHIAWKGSRDGPLAPYVGQKIGEFWVDKSPQENGDPEHIHLETTSRPHATALDNMINVVGDPAVAAALKTMPEAMADVHGLLAHVQGGADKKARDEQERAFIMSFMSRMMDRMDTIEKRVNGDVRR